MPRVEIPNVGTVEFPDSMSGDDISKAAKKLYDDATKPKGAAKKEQPLGEKPYPSSRFPSPRATRDISMQDATKNAPLAGAMIGSAAGPIGTGLGAIAGKGIDIASRSFGGEEGRYSGFGGALRTIKEFGTEGVLQTALDWGLGLVAKTLAKPIESYAKRYLRPSQVAAREGFEMAGESATSLKKVGPKITQEDITVHNVSNALQKSFDDLAKQRTLSQAGGEVRDALNIGEKNFHAIYSGEYEALNKTAEEAGWRGKVDAKKVHDTFYEMFPKAERQAMLAAPKSAGPHEFAANIREDIDKLPNLDFATAHKLRSSWLEKARESGSKQAVLFAKRGSKAMDAAMEDAAKKVGTDFYDTWRATNASYKEGIRRFDNTYIEGVFKRSPEDVVKSLKSDQPSKAVAIRDALLSHGGPQGADAWRTFQRSYAEELFSNPANLKASLNKAGENLDVVFNDTKGKELLDRMQKMASAIDVAGSVDPRLLGNLHEGVRMGGLGYLGMRLGNAADQGAAWMYVKIAESPGATKIFVDGLSKHPGDVGAATANLARALYIAGKDKAKPSEYKTPAEQAATQP